MARFPVVNELVVEGFSLFPGVDGPFRVDFSKPLTLLVGANGIGKSTALQMVYRGLVGPFAVGGTYGAALLGTANTSGTRVAQSVRRMFASRCDPDARNPSFTLDYTIGDTRVRATRSLRDMSLLKWESYRDSVEFSGDDETSLKDTVTSAADIGDYGDWILLVDFVLAILDDRRVTFWDPDAQAQVLRVLLMPPPAAGELQRLQRVALEADSAFRNLRPFVNKERRRFESAAQRIADADDVQVALATQAAELADHSQELSKARLAEAAAIEQVASLAEAVARTASDLADADAAVDKARFATFKAAMPTQGDTAAYIGTLLLRNSACPHCRRDVSPAGIDLATNTCPVCGGGAEDGVSAPKPSAAEVKQLQTRVELLRRQLDVSRTDERVAAELVGTARQESARILARVRKLDSEVSGLRARLPQGDSEYARLSATVAGLEVRLKEAEVTFDSAVQRLQESASRATAVVLDRAERVRERFVHFASEFMFDQSSLTWRAQERSIGQSSAKVLQPLFEFVTTSDLDGQASHRSSASEVSESQKEFLDLAFRMALIDTASEDASATLMLDTPESSLDAVFARRAARVLSAYAAEAGHRLVVASNLTRASLIEDLYKTVGSDDTEVVNLIERAKPTSATIALGGEYRDAFAEVFNAGG